MAVVDFMKINFQKLIIVCLMEEYVGRITVYSIVGCPHCKAAKARLKVGLHKASNRNERII